MEIKKSYLAMIKAFPGSWDGMAGALGMSKSVLENRIYERKGQSVLVDTAMQVQAFSGTTKFAEAVAIESGGTFVKLPEDISLDNEPIGRKFRELSTRFGDLSKRYDEATADDVIDSKERADLEVIAAGIHRAVAELTALTFRMYCKPDGERA